MDSIAQLHMPIAFGTSIGLIIGGLIGLVVRQKLKEKDAAITVNKREIVGDIPLTFSTNRLNSIGGKTTIILSADQIVRTRNDKSETVQLSELKFIDLTPAINKKTNKATEKYDYPAYASKDMREGFHYITLFGENKSLLMQIQVGGYWIDEAQLIYDLLGLAASKKITVSDVLQENLRLRYPRVFQ